MCLLTSGYEKLSFQKIILNTCLFASVLFILHVILNLTVYVFYEYAFTNLFSYLDTYSYFVTAIIFFSLK